MEQILQYLFYAFLLYLALINLIAAGVAIYDKQISKRPRGSIRRIPEKTFVQFSMLGGGIGTLLTMLSIHHKTKDHNVLLLKITLWTAVWIVLLLLLLRQNI